MKLIIKYFGKIIKELPLEEGQEYLLGRAKDCDICLSEDKSLSRKHIKISYSDTSNHFVLEALSKRADLYLEGEQVSSLEITQNCCFNLKNYSLDFVFPEPEREESEKSLIKEKTKEISLVKESSVISSEEKTQLVASPHLLYSLHISIEGEFSDYINLNVGEKWLIGRSPECDVCIDYDLLTRRHIEVLKKSQLFYVKDLGSANKTYLNGKAIPSHKEILLKVNDKIHIEDLNILFEARNTEYESMMNNLPVLKETKEADSQAFMPIPKLILEELVEEDEEEEENKSAIQKLLSQKKFLFALPLILIIGAFAFYKHYEDKKKVEMALKKEMDEETKKAQWQVLYEKAQEKLQQRSYLECISDIENLHSKVPNNYYEDSVKIMKECEFGLELNRQKKAEEERERQRLETEKKIQEIATHCLKQYQAKKIQTVEELNECAQELFNLDPSNATISDIRTAIEEEEMQKRLAEEEKQKHRAWIQSKKSLYNKAKKLGDKDKALPAVAAYNRFLKSSRGIASLKSLRQKARSERDFIQNKYDSHLEGLLSRCSSSIENENYKEAWSSCRKVLDFKPYDERAIQSIQTAENTLRIAIKPLYEESQWHESFSRIEEARKIWEKILEKDIKGGYYYKKARAQIKKYE